MSELLEIQKPRKTVIPITEALNLRAGNALIQRKYDGEFCVLRLRDCADPRLASPDDPIIDTETVLLCERVGPKSGACRTPGDLDMLRQYGEFYAAFDIAAWNGINLLRLPTCDRWGSLRLGFDSYLSRFSTIHLILAESVSGGEGVESLMAAGAEGVCIKPWEAPYGDMLAAKRFLNYLVRVTGFNEGQSVTVADMATGKARGSVPLRAGKIERVRVGSLLKLNGLGLTHRGFIRDPRLDQDAEGSWLVKF